MDILFLNYYVMCFFFFNKICFNLDVVIKLMFVVGKGLEFKRDFMD